MKSTLILALLTLSLSSNAQSLRSECENYYYATGNVKLHEYTAIVSWSKISDSSLEKLENIIYDDFVVLSEKNIQGKTIFKIKESNSTDAMGYNVLLQDLVDMKVRVSCTYNI